MSTGIGKGRFCYQVIAFTNKPGIAHLRFATGSGYRCFIGMIGNSVMQQLLRGNAESKNQQQYTGYPLLYDLVLRQFFCYFVANI